MSEKFRLDRNFAFQNTFYTKCINKCIIFNIIDSTEENIIVTVLWCVQDCFTIIKGALLRN